MPLAGCGPDRLGRQVLDDLKIRAVYLSDGRTELVLVSVDAQRIKGAPRVALVFDGVEVGELSPDSSFQPDKPRLAKKILGTDDVDHPGVDRLMRQGDVFVGGPVTK
jgi:hypothetical protein